jgi:GTP pyrophosphokinase
MVREIDSASIEKAKQILNEKCSPINVYKTETAVDILKSIKMDDTTLVVAYIFVAFAHEHITKQDVLDNFNEEVLEMLESSVKIHRVEYNNEEQEAENIRKLYFALAKDLRVIIIKLALVLGELKNEELYSDEEKRKKAKTALDLFAPLAARLGMSTLKDEIETLAFKILEPEKYDEIKLAVDRTYGSGKQMINEITEYLKKVLKELNITGEVTGRQKHIYSIYRKMQNKNAKIDNLFDLVALRVIVGDVSQCYSVLGKIHADLTPIPYRFKDYIATPKSNGYQSLHTTVFWKDKPIEIQIRTYEMHRAAEYGYCAHWMYKENRTNADSLDQRLGWIRETIDSNKSKSSKEIIDSFRTDIYDGEIFVLSPLGKVVHLPKGSSPIDFAYAIHSAVGNKCVGAKINGKMVPLLTPLNNGDVVEIITSQNSKGPSRDWLKFAKLVATRTKIKQFFKREMKDDTIKMGKSIFESEVKNTGVIPAVLLKKEHIEDVFKKYSFENMDELYASIGNNNISAKVVVNKFVQLYKAEMKAQHKLLSLKEKPGEKNEKAVVVKGVNNLMIKFATCCNPIPNDEIIGFISQGRGIVVHRKNCKNVENYQRERLIEVEWSGENHADYHATLLVFTKSIPDVTTQISSLLTENKIALLSLIVEQKRANPAIRLSIVVQSRDRLQEVIKKISSIQGVGEVRRL